MRINKFSSEKQLKALRRMRGKVIHYLCLLGYTDDSGQADYGRINEFIVNIGSRNPRRVILNYLYKDELLAVLNQVEAIYKKETGRL